MRFPGGRKPAMRASKSLLIPSHLTKPAGGGKVMFLKPAITIEASSGAEGLAGAIVAVQRQTKVNSARGEQVIMPTHARIAGGRQKFCGRPIPRRWSRSAATA